MCLAPSTFCAPSPSEDSDLGISQNVQFRRALDPRHSIRSSLVYYGLGFVLAFITRDDFEVNGGPHYASSPTYFQSSGKVSIRPHLARTIPVMTVKNEAKLDTSNSSRASLGSDMVVPFVLGLEFGACFIVSVILSCTCKPRDLDPC